MTQAALISSASTGGEALPALVRLPEPAEAASEQLIDVETAHHQENQTETAPSQPTLLPPVALDAEVAPESIESNDEVVPMLEGEGPLEAQVAEPLNVDESAAAATTDNIAEAFEPPVADAPLDHVSPVASGEPTGAMVSERAQDQIRRAYALARRGAYFAARRELVDVLRSIAEAKDQLHGAPRRTTALASGLRALDEAEDFCPGGAAADAQLSVSVIASSHQTPEGKSPAAAALMPQQLADLYLRYAQVQLGASVAGEPAGSMALHALGKIYSQFGELDPEEAPLAGRQGFALQHAALLARADNHLAAHELGVMLAESGHYVEAEYMLRQVALREPNTVVFRNLARVQRKLGREDLAAASDRQAQAAAGVTAYANVRWVPPQALAQTADAVPPDPTRIAAGPPRPHSAAPMPGGRVQPTYVR